MPCWLSRYLESWSVGSEGLKPRMNPGSAWQRAQNSGIQVRSTWRTSALGQRAAMSGVITSFSGEPPWQPEHDSPRRKCTSLTKLLRFSSSLDCVALGSAEKRWIFFCDSGSVWQRMQLSEKTIAAPCGGQLQRQEGLEVPRAAHGERIHVLPDELARVRRKLLQVRPVGVSEDRSFPSLSFSWKSASTDAGSWPSSGAGAGGVLAEEEQQRQQPVHLGTPSCTARASAGRSPPPRRWRRPGRWLRRSGSPARARR